MNTALFVNATIGFCENLYLVLNIFGTMHVNLIKLEKGFQEKPIVAFTNSTVFILDFNI